MKLSKSILAAVAIGISVGALTTSCNTQKKAQNGTMVDPFTLTPIMIVEDPKDCNGNLVTPVEPIQEYKNDPCPACGRG